MDNNDVKLSNIDTDNNTEQEVESAFYRNY